MTYYGLLKLFPIDSIFSDKHVWRCQLFSGLFAIKAGKQQPKMPFVATHLGLIAGGSGTICIVDKQYILIILADYYLT